MCCSLRKHCGGAGLDDSSVRCSVVQHVTAYVLQCVAAYVLQCVAAYVLQCVAAYVLQCVAAYVLQCVAAYVLQCVAAYVLQCVAAYVLQCVAAYKHYTTHTQARPLSLPLSHTHMCIQIPQSDQTPRFCSPPLYMLTTHMQYMSTAHMIDVCMGKWSVYVHRYVCVRVCVYTTPCAHRGMPTNLCRHPYGRKTHTSIHIHTCVHTYGHIHTNTHVFACVHMRCKSRESESEIHL